MNTVEIILSISAFIVAVGSAWTYIYKALKPARDLQDVLHRDKQRLDRHDEQIRALQEDNKQLLLCLNTMLAHMETGNNTGEMRERRQELTEYLIKRG